MLEENLIPILGDERWTCFLVRCLFNRISATVLFAKKGGHLGHCSGSLNTWLQRVLDLEEGKRVLAKSTFVRGNGQGSPALNSFKHF